MVALPVISNYINKFGTVDIKHVMRSKKDGKFDILCNHVVYEKKAFDKILYPDTITFTIIREPFAQFVSAFRYYQTYYDAEYLSNLTGRDPITQYLSDPMLYEPNISGDSYTDNRMSYDLGLLSKHKRVPSEINSFVRNLDVNLSLVLLLEYMDESMILLKRILCWNMKDVLYVKQNVMDLGNDIVINTHQRSLHRMWAKADYILYDYFYTKFWSHIRKQGVDFHDEVRTYADIRSEVLEFCTHAKTGELRINETHWEGSFTVTVKDCEHMFRTEVNFVEFMRRFQYDKRRKWKLDSNDNYVQHQVT